MRRESVLYAIAPLKVKMIIGIPGVECASKIPSAERQANARIGLPFGAVF